MGAGCASGFWTVQLPFPQSQVALAPDGRRVALVAVHALSVVTRSARRLLATDARQEAPSWIPDGKSVVYFDTHGRLLLRGVGSGGSRVLTRGRYAEASLSADGRTVYVIGTSEAQSIPK